MRLEPFTLTGRHVVLEPLAQAHADALVTAADRDRSSFGYTLVPGTDDEMHGYIESLLAAARSDTSVPFVQRLAHSGEVVGCTRFLDLRWWGDRSTPAEVEIGGTWLRADVQRTAVNTEAKLLLLAHAFEVWQVHRVAICTDARNERSRTAIARLGAQFEGVLRNHRPAAGHAVPVGGARDTAVYSIVTDEWPTVRAGLLARLALR
ncbi:MAG: GNAT family N-acetyltransferase [Acidobacteria bacterium]|nr:GNAT family N-acetyltransferase [Acidobacteriota bacterium]